MLRKDTLEFVIAVYNEEACLPTLMTRLLAIRERMTGVDVRFLFVNDGSRDGSLGLLRSYAREYPFVSVIGLSRNFGHQAAVTAGLDHTSAHYVCILDSDLQDPPELAEPMYQRAEAEGLNVLYGVRSNRPGETAFKRFTAAAFYRVLGALCQVDVPRNTGDFRLIDRKVVHALRQMRETHRFLRAMVPWLGFKSAPFPYDREPRYAGETKYPLQRMVRLAADAIFSFSRQPLRLAAYAGVFVIGAGFMGLVYMIYLKFSSSGVVPGVIVVLTAILIIGGMQMFMLGIIGDYLGRVYEEGKGRPLYLVDCLENMTGPGGPPETDEPSGSR